MIFPFLIIALITLFVLGVKWRQSYWQRKGLYQVEPKFFFGVVKELFLNRKAFGNIFAEIYKEIKSKNGKHGGFYFFLSPTYMPIDPIIIKHILIKNFDSFMDHGVYFNEEHEPLTGHIFNLEGSKWKMLRAKLTPTFTSGKMKNMYQILFNCAENLKELVAEKANNKQPLDIKEICARYTMDVIGNCAFGITCNSIKDPECEFRKMGLKVFEWNWREILNRLATNLLPKKMCSFLGVKLIHKDVSRFFGKVINDVVEYREKHNFFRQDFMHLLLQLKNHGKLTDDTNVTSKNSNVKGAISLNELAAQCFIFFFAGYETSATTMTFALFELSLNHAIQDKLRAEINSIWEQYGNSYDSIMKMTYLEKVLYETLRKYPPLTGTTRVCNTSYKVPNSNLVIAKGTNIHIPIIGIHMDPAYYPDPEKFDPERFNDDVVGSRPAHTWLPFGDGPRMCIGLRFGLLQSKIGLAAIIKNFKFTINNKTKLPIEMDPNSIIYSSKCKIWLDVKKI